MNRPPPPWLSALVLAVLLLPLWFVELPVFSDFPNHLARLHILHELANSAYLQAAYVADWRLLPNLALELVASPFLALFSLATTGKIFLSLVVILWHTGVQSLGLSLYGRRSWRALLVSGFVYNGQFLSGYCNFAFSVGLAAWALAYVARWRLSRSRRHFLTAAVLGNLSFFAHLGGFTSFAMVVAIWGLQKLYRARNFSNFFFQHAVLPLPGVGLFAILTARNAAMGSAVEFSSPRLYATHAMMVITSYVTWLDVLLLLALMVAVGLCVRFGKTPQDQRLLGQRDSALAAGVLFLAFVAMPFGVATAEEINARYLVLGWAFATFALPRPEPARFRRVAWAVPAVASLAHLGGIAGVMSKHDQDFQAQRRLFRKLPRGVRIHVLHFMPPGELLPAERLKALAAIHTPTWAVATHDADMPVVYMGKGLQPLNHKAKVYRGHRFGARAEKPIPFKKILGYYDYAWLCRAPRDQVRPLTKKSVMLGKIGDCKLYQLPRARRSSALASVQLPSFR